MITLLEDVKNKLKEKNLESKVVYMVRKDYIKQIRYEHYSNDMTYHKFTLKHDKWLLTYHYRWYIKYLYDLHNITCSYSTFAYKCRELGADKAILLHK